jgi:hypothetical protein
VYAFALSILRCGAEALPKVPTLTPKQTELLFTIWKESRFKPSVKLTHAVLAAKLKDDEAEVRRTIAEIKKKVSDKYLLRSSVFPPPAPGKKTPKGQNYYLLNDEWVATYPETASLLQMLGVHPPAAAFRIDRAEFESHAAEKLKLPQKFVQQRINKAIAVEYVKADGEYIYPGWRMSCEADYLSRLAAFDDIEKRPKRYLAKGI